MTTRELLPVGTEVRVHEVRLGRRPYRALVAGYDDFGTKYHLRPEIFYGNGEPHYAAEPYRWALLNEVTEAEPRT